MFVGCECCVVSGRSLCDELITRLEESYRMWCVVVCDLETPTRMRRSWPTGGLRRRKQITLFPSHLLASPIFCFPRQFKHYSAPVYYFSILAVYLGLHLLNSTNPRTLRQLFKLWRWSLTHWGRVTQICVFKTRLFSLHNTLNYAIQRACLRMVLLTDVYRNLTSLWIKL